MSQPTSATLLYHATLGQVLAAVTRRSDPVPKPALTVGQLAPAGFVIRVPQGDSVNPLIMPSQQLAALSVDLGPFTDLLLQPSRYGVKEDPPKTFALVSNAATPAQVTSPNAGEIKITVTGTLSAGPQPGTKVWALVKRQGDSQQGQPLERAVVATGANATGADITLPNLTSTKDYDVLVLVQGYEALLTVQKVS
jgi:hypothetical protein